MKRFDIDGMDIKYKRHVPDKKIIVFAVGIIIGILYFYISKGNNITLSQDFWEGSYLPIDDTGIFQYVFALRFKQLIFLMICSFSYIGSLMAYGVLGGLGFEFSLILFTFVYNYKIKGILISAAMAFPQGIFYLLLILIVFDGCFMNEKPNVYRGRGILLWKMVICVILFILGFLCETCINVEIVKKLLINILN